MAKLFAVLAISMTIATAMKTEASETPWVREPTYTDQALGKLKYGLKNTFLSWTAVFTEPADYEKMGKGVFAGIGHGLYKGFANTFLGAAHLFTFPVTAIDVPLVDRGVEIF